jgi:uncharacterized surface protein with fasciclin (FAS1) repeats
VLQSLKRWLAALAVAGTGLLAACGGGDDGPPDVVEVVSSQGSFSILAEAINAAGLRDDLIADGPFTLFAPTDAAFAALLTELGISRQALLADRALLTTVLTYHVLPAKVERAAVPLGRAITTLEGSIFKVNAASGTLTITDGRNRTSRITATDAQARNGVVHTIDRVLLPANRNIVQTAQALPQFSILVEAVVAANLQGALSGPGPLTVFAPTNDAFAALLAELGVTKEQLLANVPLLTRVLTYHVVNGRALQADIVPGQPINTLQGSPFTVSSTLAITDQRGRSAQIAATDVLATNGVIHVIDRVILPLPAENIVQTALAAPQFSILVEAVQAAGLVNALSAPGPLTVFAPTNNAFAALLTELGVTKEQLLADVPLLTRVLTYHVLNGRVLRAQVPLNRDITTLQGGVFSVGSDLVITDARTRRAGITATDTFASNGVIHTIDRVLLPLPAENIVQTALAAPQFSILVEAVQAAGLVNALSAPGPLTVFAPTNDAFAALLVELGVTKEQLLADVPLLTSVLTYHVVPGRQVGANVIANGVNGQAFTTLQGATVAVGLSPLRLVDARGRSAGITGTDTFTSNGVIHTLDRVILPPAP